MRLTTGLLFIVGAAVSSVMALKEAPTELQVGKAKISRKKTLETIYILTTTMILGIKKRIPADQCTEKSSNG